MSQNLTDGTKQALDVFNVYSEEFSKKMGMNDPSLTLWGAGVRPSKLSYGERRGIP